MLLNIIKSHRINNDPSHILPENNTLGFFVKNKCCQERKNNHVVMLIHLYLPSINTMWIHERKKKQNVNCSA